MQTLINRASFTASGEIIDKGSYSFQPGTVEVTLRGQTKRVEAKDFGGGDLVAYGFIGRYQSGGKVWPAHIWQKLKDGEISERVHFGRYDNHPKFRKENSIWFA